MRRAHLVGPSPDGGALVVATDDGEELELAVDEPLRAAVRRPRPGLETEMESALSPREIQARIRAGESPEDVAEAAGLPYERVERFAAPVLAEREHIAILALASSVRRRGETSGHRSLQATVAERLRKRGVDADAVAWDSSRLADGRWGVTATVTVDGEQRRAAFLFDPRGRFSVAGDEEGRWLLGEQAPVGADRGRTSEAEEPTVDLSDELALVRAISARTGTASAPSGVAAAEPAEGAPPAADRVEGDGEVAEDAGPPRSRPEPDEPQPEPTVAETTSEGGDAAEEAGEGADAGEVAEPVAEEPSELGTLYAMLGSDGYSEDSSRVYPGLSDASAVPETAGGGWEPPITVDVPVEPSPQEEAELPPAEHPDRTRVPMDDKAPVELSTPVDPGDALPGTDEPAPPYARTNEADRAEEAAEFELEAEPPPVRQPRRKRASVPSWDEIMFGGPKPKG